MQGRVVQPLYKHMLHPDHPTIAFIGIPTLVRCFEKMSSFSLFSSQQNLGPFNSQVVPFQLFDQQVKLFKSILTGQATLPGPQEMRAEVAREMAGMDKARRHYHRLPYQLKSRWYR